MKTWLVLTLLVLPIGEVYASDKYDGFSFYLGEEIYQTCRSKDDNSRQACAAYVCGAMDAWSADYILNRRKTYSICLPVGTTCRQLADVTLKYLEENPGQRSTAASGLVGMALKQAFPCK